MPPFDPRLTPARPDLAARHLEGRVVAARFVDGEMREVIEPSLPVRRAPSPEASVDTEALLGERVTVYETNDEGWAWGQLGEDGYVGFMPANGLAPPGPAPTHRVCALRTLVFPGPSIKLPPLGALPFGARIAVTRRADDRLVLTSSGGYVPVRHLAPVETREADFVAVAERFLGTPYLWGGKTSLGLDCSGLVQVALTACGIPCPRDTDMQEAALGEPVAGPPRRGDLMFWKGHVAIVRDGATLVHANGFHMAVALEPIGQAIARIRPSDGEVTSIRRLAGSVA
jgi:cell wall-associated NlpC family hydrolase